MTDGNKLTLESVAAIVHNKRIALGMSQEALADAAGVSRKTILRLEAGESTQLYNFLSVANALGLVIH